MFKSPDIHAPRCKKEGKEVASLELFKRFKVKHPNHNITFNQFYDTIGIHSKKMWTEVVESREGITLPENIGTLFLGSTKITKKKNVNIKESILANREILHRNWSTDGYVGKIFFTSYLTRTSHTEPEKGLWGFKGCRDFKRTVSREYPKDWKKYIAIHGTRKASQLYKKETIKQLLQDKQKNTLQTYNEFDLN